VEFGGYSYVVRLSFHRLRETAVSVLSISLAEIFAFGVRLIIPDKGLPHATRIQLRVTASRWLNYAGPAHSMHSLVFVLAFQWDRREMFQITVLPMI
jgi:hypothetical protein